MHIHCQIYIYMNADWMVHTRNCTFLNFAIQKHYYYVSRFIIAQPFNFIVQMQTNFECTTCFVFFPLHISTCTIHIPIRLCFFPSTFSNSLSFYMKRWVVFHCSVLLTLVHSKETTLEDKLKWQKFSESTIQNESSTRIINLQVYVYIYFN